MTFSCSTLDGVNTVALTAFTWMLPIPEGFRNETSGCQFFSVELGKLLISLWSPDAAPESTQDVKALQKSISVLLKGHSYLLSFNLFCKGLLNGGDNEQGQANVQKLIRRKMWHHLCSSAFNTHTDDVFEWMTVASCRNCQPGEQKPFTFQ